MLSGDVYFVGVGTVKDALDGGRIDLNEIVDFDIDELLQGFRVHNIVLVVEHNKI